MRQVERRKVMDELVEIDTRKWERSLYVWVIVDGEDRHDGRLVVE